MGRWLPFSCGDDEGDTIHTAKLQTLAQLLISTSISLEQCVDGAGDCDPSIFNDRPSQLDSMLFKQLVAADVNNF